MSFTITISGTGKMDDWAWYDDSYAPWYEKRIDIVRIIINDGVTYIGENAFYDCANLMSVTIPGSITTIGEFSFDHCENLTSIAIPDSVISIAYGAFYFCERLESVTIGNSMMIIGDSAFSFCFSLTSVIISDSVTTIGDDAFFDCMSLTNISIGNSVTNIGSRAFYDCEGLTSVILPNSVTNIGLWAFEDCVNLATVMISSGVTNIGYGAFKGCESLTDIYYGGSAAQWKEICWWWDEHNELKSVTVHYNAQDIGIGIELTDENGKTVDANGRTGKASDEKKNAFQDGAEFTASFTAADPDAVTSSELVTANVFLIFYDKNGLMASLEAKEIDLSDPFNLMFVLDLHIPEGAKTLKFLMLGDNFEPLRAVRLIESSADAA